MRSPFPGMDPYLEHPALWPDVHNGLVAALRDELAAILRPRYYVALEERTYLENAPELVLVGRPDLAVVGRGAETEAVPAAKSSPNVVEVELPMAEPVRETYLEVRTVPEGEVVTVVELLSPSNKRPGTGRRVYLEKREIVLATRTNLVEIHLLRGEERMPAVGPPIVGYYRILISRPRAQGRPHRMERTRAGSALSVAAPARGGRADRGARSSSACALRSRRVRPSSRLPRRYGAAACSA